jgi:large subunit ribosomal protein L25
MASSTSTRLPITPREPGSSRDTRRLRREGLIPGVLYGLDREPVTFAVDARELRLALASAGAVLELAVGGSTEPAILKETQKHPVRGEITHLDLLRVDLTETIQSTVPVVLTGEEEAPGVVAGGVLSFLTREVDVEALPADIPESIEFDVSTLEVGDSVSLDQLTAPSNVTLVFDDTLEEQPTLVTITAPTVEEDTDDELETETEVVGEATGGEDAGEGGEGETSDADATPES